MGTRTRRQEDAPLGLPPRFDALVAEVSGRDQVLQGEETRLLSA